MKRPALVDLLSDQAIALLPIAAVGCFARLLPILHDAGGRLELHSKVIQVDSLARLIGETFDDVEGYLLQLEEVGLLACDDSGHYCPRMVAEESVRLARAAGGHLGGNPALVRRVAGTLPGVPVQNSGDANATIVPVSGTADAVTMICKAGVAEHIARIVLRTAERRLGADAFADLVAAMVAADPAQPLGWLSQECEARAPQRKAKDADLALGVTLE